jgi:hypothetical protein
VTYCKEELLRVMQILREVQGDISSFHLIASQSICQVTSSILNQGRLQRQSKKSTFVETYSGGILVVCSKLRLNEWDQCIRSCSTLKYHCYTDSLGKRRKLGAYRLSKFDIILTTFDV